MVEVWLTYLYFALERSIQFKLNVKEALHIFPHSFHIWNDLQCIRPDHSLLIRSQPHSRVRIHFHFYLERNLLPHCRILPTKLSQSLLRVQANANQLHCQWSKFLFIPRLLPDALARLHCMLDHVLSKWINGSSDQCTANVCINYLKCKESHQLFLRILWNRRSYGIYDCWNFRDQCFNLFSIFDHLRRNDVLPSDFLYSIRKAKGTASRADSELIDKDHKKRFIKFKVLKQKIGNELLHPILSVCSD